MHSSSHPPRTFHNKSARYLGVLVGAALVAALGLPSVAQAQPPGTPTVVYMADELTATTLTANSTNLGHDHWVFEVMEPGSSAFRTMGAVPDTAISSLAVRAGGTSGHGVWKFQVYAAKMTAGDAAEDVTSTTPGAIPLYATGDVSGDSTEMYITINKSTDDAYVGSSAKSKAAVYTHGRPAAPESFGYLVTSAGGHLFTWVDANKGDTGIKAYLIRWTDGDPLLVATEWESQTLGDSTTGSYMLSAANLRKVKTGTMYTFQLMAVGTSTFTASEKDSGGNVPGMPTSLPVTIGTVPTLPELAALFLALLLLGSGAHLLRRRQSDNLTIA